MMCARTLAIFAILVTLLVPTAVQAASKPAQAEQSGPTPAPEGTINWNPELFNGRRAEFWKARKQDQGAVVFFGDSITQGWGTLPDDFPKFKVANRGISGDTTIGCLFRLKEDVLDLNPKGVVILIGTNDAGNGSRDADDIANKTKEIVEHISKFNPKIPIIVCKILPRGASPGLFPDKILQINALVEKGLKGKPNIFICDTWTPFVTKDGQCKKEEFPDMLHPNGDGYQKWAAALTPVMKQCKLIH